jgi:hypothetical protein
MKVLLKDSIIGYRKESKDNPQEWDSPKIHALPGDLLPVILKNETHFICDSKVYPGEAIIVFPSQCEEIIAEVDTEKQLPEEDYLVNDLNNLNDSLYTELESDE